MSEPNLIPITEVDINMNDVAEKLFLGPQGALIEKIETFNSRYGLWSNGDIIRITKGFKFKPGTYDRIKEAHGKYVLKYCQKPTSVWNLEDRITRHNYLNRHFWNDAKEIQSSMHQLSYSNISWQENTEIVEKFWNEFIENLQINLTEAVDKFPNSKVRIGINQDILDNKDRWKEMKMYVDLLTKDINMKVYHLDEVISEYEWGTIANRWQIPLWHFLNNWCEGGRNSATGNFASNPISRMFPKYVGLSHPYISRHRGYGQLLNDWIPSSCTGDHQSAIASSVWSLDIAPLIVNVRNWLSKYHIPNTNPLNRIRECYYGMPSGSSQKLWQHRGDTNPVQEMDRCQWPGNYRGRLRNCTNIDTGLICSTDSLRREDLVFDNPCDECEFKDEYSFDSVNGNESPSCPYAIVDYIGPQTEEGAIKEACIIHMMTCSVMRVFQPQMFNAELTDFLLEEGNRFPKDAELSNIFDILGEDFHLEYYMENEYNNWEGQDHESLLDVIFNTRVWHELIDELAELHYGEDVNPDDMAELEEEHQGSTLEELRAEIGQIHSRLRAQEHEITAINERREVNLTPEERTIRWATQNGSAINI